MKISQMIRNLLYLQKMAKKISRDVTKNVKTLRRLERREQKELLPKIPANFFTPLPKTGDISTLPAESILPTYSKLDVSGRNTHHRIRNMFFNWEITSVDDLQKIGDMKKLGKTRTIGKKSLQMLAVSMKHHHIKWIK